MKAKQFLLQYKEALVKADILKDKIEQIEATLTTAARIDGTPKANFKDSLTEKTAIKLAILKDKYKHELLEAELLSQYISDIVLQIPNNKYKTLLYYRYIKLYKWAEVNKILSTNRSDIYEDKTVMGYMNGRALAELQNIIDERNI